MTSHLPISIVRTLAIPSLAALSLLAIGCELKTNNRVEVAPIEIKPIHLTVDVNLRIDRSLDEFFSYQRPSGTAVDVPAPTTVPTTLPR